MSKKNELLKVYLLGIFFALLVGFSFVGTKTGLVSGSALEVLVYRYNFAFIGCVVYAAIKKESIKAMVKLLPKLVIIALLYHGFMAFQTIGLITCTSVISSILFAITPIMVCVLAWTILNERLSRVQIFSVLITFGATIFLIFRDSNTGIAFTVFGLTMLVISSLSMAFYNIQLRREREGITPFQVSFVTSALGMILFNGIYFVGIATGQCANNYMSLAIDYKFIMSTSYLGILCITVTSMLMAYLAQKLPAARATAFNNIGTGISLIAGVMILGETLHIYHIICAAIIVLGVFLVNKGDKENEHK